MEWHPEEKNVIRIVDKSSGEEVGAEYRVRYTTGLANIKHLLNFLIRKHTLNFLPATPKSSRDSGYPQLGSNSLSVE